MLHNPDEHTHTLTRYVLTLTLNVIKNVLTLNANLFAPGFQVVALNV